MFGRFTKWLLLGIAMLSIGHGVVAYAADYGQEAARTQAGLPDSIAGENTLPAVIGKLVAYGLSAIGLVFFFLVIYAGFLWMTAMGNTEKTESAKHILEAAIIGLVIVLGAYAITSFVFTGLTTGSTASTTTAANGAAVDANTCAAAFPDKNASCVDINTPSNCAAPRVATAGYCPGAATIQCCHD